MARERPDTPVELKVRALRYLARREHSRAELARKLVPYAESAQALAALLDELAGRKQLSDERYAETRASWLSRKYGAAKVRQDLKAHGVADAIVERITPSGEEERARAILARKYRTAATSHEEKARRARFLQSRGFSYDTIRRALALSDGE
ncbi:MAG: recombination regulator RecX [Betaproteobacteria bacterium]|nr:MAG: recombination regulator RecX [Betaproteobacteria bacterium]